MIKCLMECEIFSIPKVTPKDARASTKKKVNIFAIGLFDMHFKSKLAYSNIRTHPMRGQHFAKLKAKDYRLFSYESDIFLVFRPANLDFRYKRKEVNLANGFWDCSLRMNTQHANI